MAGTRHPITLAVEGELDEVVLRRLIEGLRVDVGDVYGHSGKAYLLSRLPAYNYAARFAPWMVLMDLDLDEECPPPFIAAMLPDPSDGMRLRLAVRSVEAWLMADRERFAEFLGIDAELVPRFPEREQDPKARVVRLAGSSRKKAVRNEMVPRKGSTAKVGLLYNERLIEFVTARKGAWRWNVAARCSESLRRCLAAVRTLKRLRW